MPGTDAVAALQHKLDEPVLAGGLFHRPHALEGVTLGPFSGMFALVARGVGRRRTGGLPHRFMIAVTPTRVHVFGCTTATGELKVKEELAAWSRAGMTVTAEETAMSTKVVIRWAGAEDPIVCSTGKDELSQSVVYAMQEPVGVAA